MKSADDKKARFKQYDSEIIAGLRADTLRLRAENERLRAALREPVFCGGTVDCLYVKSGARQWCDRRDALLGEAKDE